MKKVGNFFLAFVPIIIALCMMTASAIAVMIPAMVLGGGHIEDNQNYIASIIFAIAGIIVFGIWYKKVSKSAERNRTVSPLRLILAIIILVFFLVFISQVITSSFFSISPALEEQYNSIIDSLGLTEITWLAAIYAIIAGPICEELIFRGLTLHYFRKAIPAWLAILLQAALFGIYHGNLVQGSYAFVAGLIFGLICYKGGGIKWSIICHIIYNILGTFFVEYFFFNGSYGMILNIIIIVVTLLLGLTLLLKNTRKSDSKKRK